MIDHPLGFRMSNAKYHAHPALSRSKLFWLTQSPAYFRYRMDTPSPATDALTFGSVFHKLVLEPRYFSREFLIAPEINRRTNAGREQYATIMARAEAGRRTVIDQDMYDLAAAMRDSLLRNRYARLLLDGAQVERSFFWTDEITGTKCKCRPDAINIVGGTAYIIDLKSCLHATPRAFRQDAVAYGYPLQTAMCREGVRRSTGLDCRFIFACVEKSAPHFVALYEADELFLRYGEDQMRELLDLHRDCSLSGNWYGYGGPKETVMPLSLPDHIAKNYL